MKSHVKSLTAYSGHQGPADYADIILSIISRSLVVMVIYHCVAEFIDVDSSILFFIFNKHQLGPYISWKSFTSINLKIPSVKIIYMFEESAYTVISLQGTTQPRGTLVVYSLVDYCFLKVIVVHVKAEWICAYLYANRDNSTV